MTDALTTLGIVVTVLGGLYGLVKVWRDAAAASSARRFDEIRALKEDYRTRLAEVADEVATLRTDVDELRRNEGRLVGWVKTLHDGIADGTIPPLPPTPAWLVNLGVDHRYFFPPDLEE